MKTFEELNMIRTEIESMRSRLQELTDEELEQVTGGIGLPIDSNNPICPNDGTRIEYTGRYSGRASDIFQCPKCGQGYEHIFYLDQWIYFNNW